MQYRNQLPQLTGQPFLTDGGLETTLVFHDGVTLPVFAAIDQLRSDEGRARLERYYRAYLALARDAGYGFILESPTWRASRDWAASLGLDETGLERLNQDAIYLMASLKHEFADASLPVVVSGCLGPRADGYQPGTMMSVAQAQSYHAHQVRLFAKAGVDCVTALTINTVEEAVGIALAARHAEVPCIMSFTVETDGRLPAGESLKAAIETVDAATGTSPAYYMVNCAHPTHFEHTLNPCESWVYRLRGIRANASTCSHAELDEAEELDDGSPDELGEDYRRLCTALPHINVLGGCCGTDIRHLKAIVHALSDANSSGANGMAIRKIA